MPPFEKGGAYFASLFANNKFCFLGQVEESPLVRKLKEKTKKGNSFTHLSVDPIIKMLVNVCSDHIFNIIAVFKVEVILN